MPTPRAVAEALLRYVGCLYVWRGKGDDIWTPSGLKPHGWGQRVFDCSGAIGQALLDAGGKDRRGTFSAQTYFDAFPEVASPDVFGALRCYGTGPKTISHIAMSLGHGLVIEAAGGDSTTTTPDVSRARPSARVRVGFDLRRDLVGARLLPGD
jgi:cell wall-associated NlpC family hydrolase